MASEGVTNKRKGNDRTRPKNLVQFIVEAIEEVAPGRGREIYECALQRFDAYTAARSRPKEDSP